LLLGVHRKRGGKPAPPAIRAFPPRLPSPPPPPPPLLWRPGDVPLKCFVSLRGCRMLPCRPPAGPRHALNWHCSSRKGGGLENKFKVSPCALYKKVHPSCDPAPRDVATVVGAPARRPSFIPSVSPPPLVANARPALHAAKHDPGLTRTCRIATKLSLKPKKACVPDRVENGGGRACFLFLLFCCRPPPF